MRGHLVVLGLEEGSAVRQQLDEAAQRVAAHVRVGAGLRFPHNQTASAVASATLLFPPTAAAAVGCRFLEKKWEKTSIFFRALLPVTYVALCSFQQTVGYVCKRLVCDR